MLGAQNSNHPCRNCAFYEGSVWQPVDTRSVLVLTRGFSRQALDEGQTLFNQGDKNQGLFCVSKGLIALRTLHPDGTSTLMRLAYPGEIIGFRSFLGDREHRTEARALLPSRICSVEQRDADRIVRGNPAVLEKLASRCVFEIDRNRERIIASSTKSNKQRLADLLLRLMEEHGDRAGDHVSMQLPLSRMDLADLIGVQPETMSRLVRRLESDGFFHFSGREVQIPATGLHKMAANQ
ncbi:MAG: Crp/Fnr family transcriptional regulator [Rhodobacteraceae bacterium]|nr:Crp/Fnr family transcriptional regulator [Paracoccaceae bacterium]